MLPFLKKTKEASVSGPVETLTRGSDESEPDMLSSMAEELIEAIHSKDASLVASTLKSIFQVCDSEPHEEGPHV